MALTIQGDQRIATQQLRLGQTHQQLTGRHTARTLLDRPDPAVERGTTSSFSTNSATAATPDVAVSDGSGAPIQTRFRAGLRRRTLFTDRVLFPLG